MKSNYNELSEETKNYFKHVLAFHLLSNSEVFFISNNNRIVFGKDGYNDLVDYDTNINILSIYDCEYDIDYNNEDMLFAVILNAISGSVLSKYEHLWSQRNKWKTNFGDFYKQFLENKHDKTNFYTILYPFIEELIVSYLLRDWKFSEYLIPYETYRLYSYQGEDYKDCALIRVLSPYRCGYDETKYSDVLIFSDTCFTIPEDSEDEYCDVLRMFVLYLISKTMIDILS